MKLVNIIVAIISGAIVLLGYFIPNEGLQSLRTPLLNWALILSGIAGLVAIINLVFMVHWKKLKEPRTPKMFSLVVLLAFLGTLVVGIISGPSSVSFKSIVTDVAVPIETSLMAMLAISLSYASIKILQRHRNFMGFIFFFAVIFSLVLNTGILAFSTDIPLLRYLLSGLHQLPVAGARGILLGIALGSLVTGIRVLLGTDRPYNG